MLFFQYPWKFHILNPLTLLFFFFWNTPLALAISWQTWSSHTSYQVFYNVSYHLRLLLSFSVFNVICKCVLTKNLPLANLDVEVEVSSASLWASFVTVLSYCNSHWNMFCITNLLVLFFTTDWTNIYQRHFICSFLLLSIASTIPISSSLTGFNSGTPTSLNTMPVFCNISSAIIKPPL